MPNTVARRFADLVRDLAEVDLDAVDAKQQMSSLKQRALAAIAGRKQVNLDFARRAAKEQRDKAARLRYEALLPVIDRLRAQGIKSLGALAKALDDMNRAGTLDIKPPRAGQWSRSSIRLIEKQRTKV